MSGKSKRSKTSKKITLLPEAAKGKSLTWEQCPAEDWEYCFSDVRGAHAKRSFRAALEGQAVPRQASATKPKTVDEYLSCMQATTGILKPWDSAFANADIFLVHHLTAEVLGVIAALRKMKCQRIFVVFTGYNQAAEGLYMPSLRELDHFGALVLHQENDWWAVSKSCFDFKSGDVSDATLHEIENKLAATHQKSFTAAMQLAVTDAFLSFTHTVKGAKNQLLLIEDGGYIAPLLHNACEADKTIDAFRKDYGLDPEEGGSDKLASLLKDTLVGGVEHTRNGYDSDMLCKKFAFPMGSIAVSYLKTVMESETVAASILTATQDILYALGFVLKKRHIMLFGSRGNIGRQLAKHLEDTIDPGELQQRLFGCDLKVGTDGTSRQRCPGWMPDDSMPCAVIKEYKTYKQFPEEDRNNVDLILGVTGGPTKGHPLFETEDLGSWLLHGKSSTLYLVSGSTKQAEFARIMVFLTDAVDRGYVDLVDESGIAVRAYATVKEVHDPLSDRFIAKAYTFEWTTHGDPRTTIRKTVMLMGDGMPINFTFYGVTTEIIDEVLAQLVCVGAQLNAIQQHKKPQEEPLENRMYAVDFNGQFTQSCVFGSHDVLKPGEDFPLPKPGPM
eukprot:TRINITY_DN3894_c0_g1_i1.p1 TRINITY_DN3894_c0_g1~~TRINITY_DN3894_c0_g1_i1.p1  ORF type:complete len:615 (+),score=151.04 TRINITY_DN3894_c0_g1_i1:936-2780(+)